ncbi:hypothetical protein OG933_41990 [Streptomyces sp. NBC_00016]|uniref:hypothetical protein n=1 Tax=Streptomyces sp. NBC_00016 TaxID=2975622 RepID=UPI0032547E4B
MALETYAGPDEEWVHQAAIRLSEGHLHRLAHWLNSAERELGASRWYADEPSEISPQSHRFAVEFINGLTDKESPWATGAAVSRVPYACTRVPRSSTPLRRRSVHQLPIQNPSLPS